MQADAMTDNTDNAETDLTTNADQTAVMTPVPEIAENTVPVTDDPELPENAAIKTPAPTGDELLEKYGPAAKPKSDKTIADLEEEARVAALKPRWRLLRYLAYTLAVLLLVAGVLGGVFAYLYTRPNASEIDPALNLQH